MHYAFMSDQQIVESARRGSEEAFRVLIDRYQRPVFSLIFRLVRNREKAEDLAQDTFVKVFRALHQYDPQYKFSSWVFRIAHYEAIADWRKRELDTLSLDGAPHARNLDEAQSSTISIVCSRPRPDQQVYDRELGGEIDRALAELRPEYRSAIILRHVEGRSYQEIADILAVPLGTVKTYIHRGRAALIPRLEHLRPAAAA